jgi:hypothetical protein
MKKILSLSISIIGIVGIVGVLAWFGSKNQTGAQNSAGHNVSTSLLAPEKSYDFGTVSMAAGKVKHNFEISNSSDRAVTIRSIATSCMCTEANLLYNQERFGPFGMSGMSGTSLDKKIQPGDKVEVETIFDPAAHGPAGVGPISREVTIETDSGMVTLDFNANVTP